MTRFNQWFTDSGAQGTKIVNVKYFGAVADWQGGATGTDNTQAFQDAIDYAQSIFYPSVATVLYIPMGRYRIGGKLTQATQLIWRGEGKTGATGYGSGTQIGFNHSFPGCIYLDTTAAGGLYFGSTLFEDLYFYGVNQSIEQHCLYGIHGAVLLTGGFNRVGFDSFTGCCIYFPAGSDAYYQNLSLRDVSTSVVGGFYGADSSLTLTCTMLTSDNFNLSNGVNTAFPQHAFFDFKTARELNIRQSVVEGGSLNSSIFTFGCNTWIEVNGLHVENGPPVNVFEYVTGGYPYGTGGSVATFSDIGAIPSGKLIKFNSGMKHNNITLYNAGSGITLANLVDDQSGNTTNHVYLDGWSQSGAINLTSNLLSTIDFCNSGILQFYPTDNPFSVSHYDDNFVSLRGQWLDGAHGGPVTMAVDGATIANMGMYTDSVEGRVFELVSLANTRPVFSISIAAPTDLVGQQVALVMRYYVDTTDPNVSLIPLFPLIGANQPSEYCYSGDTSTTPPPVPDSNLPLNVWHTAMCMFKPPNTTTVIVATGQVPTSPGYTGTTKLRIAAIYVAPGRTIPFLLGGGALKPITWLATAAPTYGDYVVGDQVTNSVPTVGQPKGWVCTVAGSPGTWVSLGNL